MYQSRLRRACQSVIVGIALAVTQGAVAAPIDEVPSGTMLTKDNWEIAKGLMPDEILEFYKRGEYANPILKLEAVNRPSSIRTCRRRPRRIAASSTSTRKEPSSTRRAGSDRRSSPAGRSRTSIRRTQGRLEGDLELVLHAVLGGAFHTQSPVNWISRDGLLRRIETDVTSSTTTVRSRSSSSGSARTR